MSQARRYEEVLGRLGAFLACQDARRIEIADEGQYMVVSWLSRGATARQHACFRDAELERLRPPARFHVSSPTSRAMLLGSLGRRLDQSGIDVARIEEKTDSFQISGALSGRYSNQRVSYWELRGEPAPRLDAAATAPAPERGAAEPAKDGQGVTQRPQRAPRFADAVVAEPAAPRPEAPRSPAELSGGGTPDPARPAVVAPDSSASALEELSTATIPLSRDSGVDARSPLRRRLLLTGRAAPQGATA